MEIVKVTPDSKEMDEFVDLPWSIYPDKHKWVPPLKASIKMELSPHNLFFQHGEAQAFICKDKNKVVGRIVASVDDKLTGGEKTGYFGYFEAIDDVLVAKLLLEAAEKWLKEKGKTIIQGPVNLNIYTAYRVQTAGFNTEPFVGEPRSPEYYLNLLNSAGYEKHASWNSWDIPASVIPIMESAMDGQLGAFKASDSNTYRVDFYNPEKFEEEMENVYPIAMDSFSENYGFSEIDLQEFTQVYSGLAQIMSLNPEFFGTIVKNESEMTAFAFGYLNYSEAFHEMDGDISKFPLIANHKPKTAVFHTFGVRHDYRKTVIPYFIFKEGFKSVHQRGCNNLIGALAKEGRTAYDKLGAPGRSYSIFQKEV